MNDNGHDLDARRAVADHCIDKLTEDIVMSVEAGVDFGDVLSAALGAAADRVGGVQQLVRGRPGSWEAMHVIQLAIQYADTRDEEW